MKNAVSTYHFLLAAPYLFGQVEPNAGKWKTWFISSGREVRLPPPPDPCWYQGGNKGHSFCAGPTGLRSTAACSVLECRCASYRWREVLQNVSVSDTSGISYFVVCCSILPFMMQRLLPGK